MLGLMCANRDDHCPSISCPASGFVVLTIQPDCVVFVGFRVTRGSGGASRCTCRSAPKGKGTSIVFACHSSNRCVVAGRSVGDEVHRRGAAIGAFWRPMALAGSCASRRREGRRDWAPMPHSVTEKERAETAADRVIGLTPARAHHGVRMSVLVLRASPLPEKACLLGWPPRRRATDADRLGHAAHRSRSARAAGHRVEAGRMRRLHSARARAPLAAGFCGPRWHPPRR